MGKNAKKKRRMKKTVRRTIGALCLLSAITIAAIPVPENRADTPGGSASALSLYTYEGTSPTPTPGSPTASTNSEDFGGVDLSANAGADDIAYNIREISGNNIKYEIYDMYSYRIANFRTVNSAATVEAAIITNYNDSYGGADVRIDGNIFKGFKIVSESDLTAFYSGTFTGDYTYDGDLDQSNDRKVNYYTKYFKTQFDTYNNQYRQYKAGNGAKPSDLKFLPSAIDPTNTTLRNECYCEEKLELWGRDATLERVKDSRSSITGSTGYVYLVKIRGNSEGLDGDLTPNTRFWVDDVVSIRAIGNNSFANASSIRTLYIGGDITYIGDDAFSGCTTLGDLTLDSVKVIGYRAFKGVNLESVKMPSVTKIGDEAFMNCQGLKEVKYYYDGSNSSSLQKIGNGAFAGCLALNDIDLSKISDVNATIGDGAFYDCGLSNIYVGGCTAKTMGIGVFATNKGKDVDKLTSIDLSLMNNIVGIGDQLFSGRTALTKVIMPGSYGSTSPVLLGENTFAKCENLETLEFPDQCADVKFEGSPNSDIFSEVTNSKLYVKGPKNNASGKALERTDTYTTKNKAGNPVPYCFTDNNTNYYEIAYTDGNGNSFIESVKKNDDNTGILASCDLISTPSSTGIDLVVPKKVGNISLTAIEQGALGSATDGSSVLSNIKSVEFIGGITEIPNSMFASAPKLETVTLGDELSKIGNGAFQNCRKLNTITIGNGIASIGDNAFSGARNLETVSFDTPSNGYDTLTIGNNAFETGGSKLTFKGEIAKNYAPFTYAMNPDRYVDSGTGVRVRYISNDGLTVILDNVNNLATLVDYPHYETLSDEEKGIVPTTLKDKLNGGPDSASNATAAEINLIKRMTGVSDDTKNKILDQYDTGAVNLNSLLTADEQNAIANSPFYLSPSQQNKFNFTSNLVVPEGVESVDSKGYFTNKSKYNNGLGKTNDASIAAYFTPTGYTGPSGTYRTEGLFNGYYGDGTNTGDNTGYTSKDWDGASAVNRVRETPLNEANAIENVARGNDNLKTVTLNSVKYLPDKCFRSCEQLENVSLGSALEDCGSLPFYQCPKLMSVGGNTKYYEDNALFYEKDPTTGDVRLVECLQSRGVKGDTAIQPSITAPTDEKLLEVTSIAPNAFDDCTNITSIDLTGVDGLTDIPDQCFVNTDRLSDIILPENIENVGDEAFAGSVIPKRVTIYSREVELDDNAFGPTTMNPTTSKPTLSSYTGTAVEKYAKKPKNNYTFVPLQDNYKVVFKVLNPTTNKLQTITIAQTGKDVQTVDRNKPAVLPAASDVPTVSGYTFNNTWEPSDSSNMTTNTNAILDDVTFIGYYTANPGPTPGTAPGTTPGVTPGSSGGGGGSSSATPTPSPTPSGDVRKHTLTVVYGSGSGQYPANTKVIIEAIAAPAGKEFDKWVVTGASATVYSTTSKATTVVTAAGDSNITATYKDINPNATPANANNSTGTYSRNGTATGTSSTGSSGGGGDGTKVNITKPGISDADKAYASVSGSTDSFVVKVTEDQNAANQIATALANKYPDMTAIKYFPMDISLYDQTGNNKIGDTSNLSVNVTMPIPDALREYAGNNKVGAVVNGNQLEELPCKFVTVGGVPCVSFTATHFSPYTIYVDTNNLVYGAADGSPKTGDPIHPKWFVVIALAATSLFLFLKKDKVTIPRTV